MKIILSRKGFDSSYGGGPSPIVEGRPISLPIPDDHGLSRTSYADLGLGDHVERASSKGPRRDDLCHHDPMFLADGTCLFGQCGGPATHLLRTNAIGPRDVFLFFGWFAGDGWPDHHRIFGYLEIAEIIRIDGAGNDALARLAAVNHPHVLGFHHRNRSDVVFAGKGRAARHASPRLCLTKPGATRTHWLVPLWLAETGLSCHGNPARWPVAGELVSVAQGQEFVTDIGERSDARAWVLETIAEIERV